MIKELFLAIILGALLGFGFTGGYLALKKTPRNLSTASISSSPIISTNPKVTVEPNISPISTPVDDQDRHKITIDSPANESLTATSSVTIKGNTTPESNVVLNTSLKSYFVTADKTGSFSISIEIESGPNLIRIDSFSPPGETASAQLLVTYSTAKF